MTTKLYGQVIVELDVPNKNNRIYSTETMVNAIAEVNRRSPDGIYGRLGMELGADSMNLNDASHIVTNLRIDHSKVLGDVQVLNTPAGNNLVAILASGQEVAYRSAGIGQISEDGHVTDFELLYIAAIPAEDAA